MFVIKFERTGLEIKISNQRGYLMLGHKELQDLGFKVQDDVWEE